MELSEYERLRLENIKKNEDFLRSLDIGNVRSSLRSQSLPVTAKKRKSFDKSDVLEEPSRRSRRISTIGSSSEHISLPDNYVDYPAASKRTPVKREPVDFEEFDESTRQRFTAEDLRKYVEENEPDHLELISDKQISHGTYRMSYMSAKALALRLSKIACRKGCVDKMLVFYYGLTIANLKSLAREARRSLESAGVEFSTPMPAGDDDNDDEEGSTDEDIGDSPNFKKDLIVIADDVDVEVERILNDMLQAPAGESRMSATREFRATSIIDLNSDGESDAKGNDYWEEKA